MEPIVMFERAAFAAAALAATVSDAQRAAPTPCLEWDKAALLGPAVEVVAGAPAQDVLLGAMGRDPRR